MSRVPLIITFAVALFLPTLPALAQSRLPACPSWPFAVWTDCHGDQSYPNGDRYIGEFKDGKRHGHGNYTYPNGDQYVGEYRNGAYFGKAIWTTTNGDKYVGVMSRGLNGQFSVTY